MPLILNDYLETFTRNRFLSYTVISLASVFAVILNALKIHSNFYSVAVYLSKSNGTVVVLGNFGVFLALLFGRVLQQVFFGPLRAMEVERLYDRTWFFVTESLLAFTIFRDEFDIPFAVMFGLLLFTKCFHWLLADRIEWMDQRPYPGPPLLFHIRINVLVTILWISDAVALLLIVESMLERASVGGTVLFASEYTILLASLLNAYAKYCIAMIDLRRASVRGGEDAPPWEDKSMWVFYVELVTDFLKLITYLTFFLLVLAYYGLPLNIIRDVYITARSFVMRFRDLLRYRTATKNMDERYPNATDEELSGMSDRTCIICREEMSNGPAPVPAGGEQGQQEQTANGQPPVPRDGPNMTPKRLPCGHVFHFYCLRSWLERQQSCPTCRRSVLDSNQNTGQNGAPAPPQPGAFPQAPNNQPVQQPQGNLGGIFGRIMGAAGMPPIVPGQFAAGPGQPVQPGAIGQQPQPQGQQAPQYNHRQQLFAQQPERFQGFYAPGGVWHQWPNAAQEAPANHQEAPVVGASTNTQAESGAETPLLPADGNRPPATRQESSSSRVISAVPVEPGTTPASATSPSNPREAAAVAALRRMNTSGSTTIASGSQERASIDQTQLQAQASTSHVTNSSTPPQGNAQVPTHIAPDLIPLYDPSPSVAPNFRSQSSPYGLRSNLFSGLSRHQASVTPTSNGQPNTGVQDESSIHSRAHRHSAQSLRNLPQTLTDEQLNTLDHLTREAIDERLRILENVQTTTMRCISELLRCRSALPRPSGPRRPAQIPSDQPQPTPTQNVQSVSEGEPSDAVGEHSNGTADATVAPAVPADGTEQ